MYFTLIPISVPQHAPHCLKQSLNDSLGDVGSRVVTYSSANVIQHCDISLTAKIGSPDFTLANKAVSRLGDGVCLNIKTKVTQHHSGRKDESSGVGLVGAHNVLSDVSTSWLEKGVFSAKVASRNDTWSTDKGGSNVTTNSTVQLDVSGKVNDR